MKKILIANRGEIAVRVARACRDAGIISVAVYSDPDRSAFHVRVADQAYSLKGSTSAETYLDQDKLLEIASQCGADAIHPGYGFLAENDQFAERCREAGIIFIGPPPEVIKLLGDKLEARKMAAQAGLPLAPAVDRNIEDNAEAHNDARRIGYPILIKAAAGGGGKGMRIVYNESELEAALITAPSEACSAFGDKRIYMEKYISRPRHIEIQILADAHGSIVHAGERECSIQRRHQKIIEEAPSPAIDDNLRMQMGEAATELARASGYIGAGTVGFLVDDNLKFYFLEVNTRLQVEHPVTEVVTGIDFVLEQFKIARQERLSFTQQDIQRHGHAIECRIYAEDASAGFMPSIGHLSAYHEPAGPGIRVDSGYCSGDTISLYYDPLMAKLISWGTDRPQAIGRMRRALSEYIIQGVASTIPFALLVMDNSSFRAGHISTHFIQDEFPNMDECLAGIESEIELMAMAAAIVDLQHKSHSIKTDSQKNSAANPWKMSGRINGYRRVE